MKYYLVFIISYLGAMMQPITAQNIQFFYTIQPAATGTEVSFFAKTVAGSEVLLGFDLDYYFTAAAIHNTTLDFAPLQTIGWGQQKGKFLEDSQSNIHGARYACAVTDQSMAGATITTAPTLLLKIQMDIDYADAKDAFVASTAQNEALSYTSYDKFGNPVGYNLNIVAAPRTQQPLESLGDSITDIQVFPNPTFGQLNIQFTAEEEANMVLEIFDQKGALVRKQQLQAQVGSNLSELDISNFATGVYSILLRNHKNQITHKIVKIDN